MIATKQIYIKPSNLKKIQDGTIEGSKFFAYIKLLENKGSEVTGSEKLKGAKMLYLGNTDYIGAKVTKYANGCFKLDQITGKQTV